MASKIVLTLKDRKATAHTQTVSAHFKIHRQSMDKENLRIQFDDFNLNHFKISPIWEFAIDEEGENGQDETTLKPRFDLKYPDPSEGLLIVECEFVTNSGKHFNGLCSPSFDDSLSSIQPYIIEDNKFVMFWFGIAQPDKEMKESFYEILGETIDSLFPIKFQSKLTMANGSKIIGQINGFMSMTLSDQKIKTEK